MNQWKFHNVLVFLRLIECHIDSYRITITSTVRLRNTLKFTIPQNAVNHELELSIKHLSCEGVGVAKEVTKG